MRLILGEGLRTRVDERNGLCLISRAVSCRGGLATTERMEERISLKVARLIAYAEAENAIKPQSFGEAGNGVIDNDDAECPPLGFLVRHNLK
jgi:hypothetical protein